MTGKWRTVGLLALAELLAMSVWFSASAVAPQLASEWKLSGAQQSWLTMSVQVGFVTGALLSAVLNLADRLPAHRLFALSAVIAAAANAVIAGSPLLDVGSGTALTLRFLTGVALAGVYPPGMKLAASWCREDRGLGIGLLVGALTLGSGVPHLLNALGSGGMPPWRTVLLTTSILCLIAAGIAAVAIRPGPFLGKAPPFDWRFAGRAFADRPTRLANFGYLGPCGSSTPCGPGCRCSCWRATIARAGAPGPPGWPVSESWPRARPAASWPASSPTGWDVPASRSGAWRSPEPARSPPAFSSTGPLR